MPDQDHPIRIVPNATRVSVRAGGQLIADTVSSLTLYEASYPGVDYIPRSDVDMSRLHRTQHTSTCPYKGEASYYSIDTGTGRIENAAWTYEDPKPAVAAIAGYLAFYPDKVWTSEDQAA